MRRALLTVAAASASRGLLHVWQQQPPGGAQRWQRTNHRGEPITLLEGPAVTAAATAALLVAPGLPAKVRAGSVIAVLGAGGFGLLDDLGERGTSKGLRGHLSALRRGEVTTGALKIVGIGGTGLLAAALVTPSRGPAAVRLAATPSGWAGTAAEVAASGVLIAACANLVNLLDLRPGRALKSVLVLAPVAFGSSPTAELACAAVGPALGVLGEDLAERSMLGDSGANALGALAGVIAVQAPPAARHVVLAATVALILISERVSFTKVIESTPVLRELDGLGRRPR